MAEDLTDYKAQDNYTNDIMAHQVTMEIVKAPPAEINPGVFITIQARVTCPMGCNFKADKILIIDQDRQVIKEAALIIPVGAAFETDPIVLKAPSYAGTYTWKAYYYEQEKEGIAHLEAFVPINFTVKPLHITGLAVWDVSSPIVTEEKMRFKVGVKCSADCPLTDQVIKVYNQENEEVALAKLGDKPWEGTQALYWTELELLAPDREGFYNWQVKFPEPNMKHLHLEAESSFSFQVVNPPECTLSILVMDKEKKLPIQGATVIFHPYRGQTNEEGKACLEIKKGEYKLYVGGVSDFESQHSRVIVQGDTNLVVELESATIIGD